MVRPDGVGDGALGDPRDKRRGPCYSALDERSRLDSWPPHFFPAFAPGGQRIETTNVRRNLSEGSQNALFW